MSSLPRLLRPTTAHLLARLIKTWTGEGGAISGQKAINGSILRPVVSDRCLQERGVFVGQSHRVPVLYVPCGVSFSRSLL